MRQHPFPRLARVGSAIVLSGLLTCAHAVELGDALVRSHLGQPLSADIELTGIVNDAATVQAGLADGEVYRGANIALHPAVAAMNIAITRRDGKRFLHLTSAKAVESDFVIIFFELNENGRRTVRQTTLWFTPDPNPAPPKPPAAAPAPVKVAAAAAPPVVVARAMPAPVVAAAPLVRAAPAARPAACVTQFTAAQIGTCAALDAKNAALSAQIVELEEKVRRLTVAMQAGAVPATAAAAAAAAGATVAKPPPPKLVPMEAPVSKPAGATPWLFIGIASAAVLALVGALLYLLKRQRKGGATRAAAPVATPRSSFIASVRSRLLPGKKDGGTVEEAGPAEA